MHNVSDVEIDVGTGNWTYIVTDLDGLPYLIILSFVDREAAEKSRMLMKNGAVADALTDAHIEITGEI